MATPTGEAKLEPLRVDFDRRVKPERHRSDIASNAGLLARSQLDHALGLTELRAWSGGRPRHRSRQGTSE